jgi:hypothetical protein
MTWTLIAQRDRWAADVEVGAVPPKLGNVEYLASQPTWHGDRRS